MALSLDEQVQAFADDFSFLGDWEERYGHVIELGKALPSLPAQERSEANRVRGCASQVWLVRDADTADGRLRFRADSDAHIVRGLLAIVLAVFSERRPEDILRADPANLVRALGLEDALTPQRTNGLASVVARIRQAAEVANQSAPAEPAA